MTEEAPLVDTSTLTMADLQGDDPQVSAALQRILRSIDDSGEAMSAFQSFMGFGSAISK